MELAGTGPASMRRLGIKPAERILAVRIGSQTLQFLPRRHARAQLSRIHLAPTAFQYQGSLGAAPRGTPSRKKSASTSRPAWSSSPACPPVTLRQFHPDEIDTENLITSRILWLRGLEREFRRRSGQSHGRYIYLRATAKTASASRKARAASSCATSTSLSSMRNCAWGMVWIGD